MHTELHTAVQEAIFLPDFPQMATPSSSAIVELFKGVVEIAAPPRLEKIRNRGRFYWRIIIGTNAKGRLVRPQIGKDEGKARAIFAEVCNRIDSGEISDAAGLIETHADLEFRAVRKKLRSYNATVSQAVDFFIQHHRPNKGVITVSEALAIWEENAHREGLSEIYIRRMKDTYAGPFAAVYGSKRLQEINFQIAEDFIFQQKAGLSAYSKRQMIQKLASFLNALAKIGYYHRDMNPFEKLTAPKEKFGVDTEKDRLLSPEFMGELLEFALASENQTYRELGIAVVLIGFCGVRKTEATRIQRSHITPPPPPETDDPWETLDPWKVRIPKLESKWGHSRTISVPDNAGVWLKYFLQGEESKQGGIFSVKGKGQESLTDDGLKTRFSRFLRDFREACEQKGIEVGIYEQNSFRVSCGSYGAKVFGVQKICEMMGEKRPGTFWQHYREDCEEAAAKRYFGIIPKIETEKRNRAAEEAWEIQAAQRDNYPDD